MACEVNHLLKFHPGKKPHDDYVECSQTGETGDNHLSFTCTPEQIAKCQEEWKRISRGFPPTYVPFSFNLTKMVRPRKGVLRAEKLT